MHLVLTLNTTTCRLKQNSGLSPHTLRVELQWSVDPTRNPPHTGTKHTSSNQCLFHRMSHHNRDQCVSSIDRFAILFVRSGEAPAPSLLLWTQWSHYLTVGTRIHSIVLHSQHVQSRCNACPKILHCRDGTAAAYCRDGAAASTASPLPHLFAPGSDGSNGAEKIHNNQGKETIKASAN